jgi:hypothetical protein
METTAQYGSVPVEIDQTAFLRKTYHNLLGAIVAFIAVEIVLFQTGIAYALAPIMTSNWLIVIGGFMILGWLSNYITRKQSSPTMQYVEMGATIVLQAFIFIPLLVYAIVYSDISVLSSAVSVTLIIFAAMTAIVAYTGKSFTFLGPFLAIIGIAALLAIVGAVIFSVTLGFYFSLAMVVFAAGVVLYQTSKVLHDFVPGQEVVAATGLFASVALLFYYVLATFISRD